MKNFTLLLLALFLVFGFSSSVVYSANDHVIISEIQLAGATAKDEFIELYNPTQSDVDLAGYRLTKKPSGATSESNLIASMSGTISAGGYYLVAHPDYGGTVLADSLYSAPSNTLSDNNILVLYSDAGVTELDKVGFGTAVEFEGTATVGNPVDNGSARRINNEDTDENSVDFELLEFSDPQNSASGSATPTPTESPTATPTATPTESPSPTPSPTVTASPSPTPTQSPSPTPTSAPKSISLATFSFGDSVTVCRLEYKSVRIGFLKVNFPRVVCD